MDPFFDEEVSDIRVISDNRTLAVNNMVGRRRGNLQQSRPRSPMGHPKARLADTIIIHVVKRFVHRGFHGLQLSCGVAVCPRRRILISHTVDISRDSRATLVV